MKEHSVVLVLAVVFSVSIFSGCAPTGLPDEVSVLESPDKSVVYSNVYIIKSPPGVGWDVKTGFSRTLYFKKNNPSHSFIAGVFLSEHQESQASHSMVTSYANDHVKALIEKTKNHDIEYTITQDTRAGSECDIVRYKRKEYDAPDRGDHEYLTQNTVDMICNHPRLSHILMLVKYSEQGPPDGMSMSFDSDAESFLNGFEIIGAR